MSQPIAVDFIRKVQADESLRADVIALGQDMDGLVALGAQHGYSFSAEDLQAAINASGYAGEGELSEDQLEAVAGGSRGAQYTNHSAWTGCASGHSGCNITDSVDNFDKSC